MIDVEITIFCESVKRGCDFRAQFYDRATQQFYSGSGATALEALAWCMDEYIARVAFGLPISMARNTTDTPGSRFPAPGVSPAGSLGQRSMTPAPAPTASPRKRRARKAA